MDNLIENYKDKINNLINTNEVLLEKIDKLEAKIKVLKENEIKFKKERDNYESKISLLEKQVRNLNSNFESEISEKSKAENQILQYKELLRESLSMLQKIQKKPNTNSPLKEQLQIFFSEINDEQI